MNFNVQSLEFFFSTKFPICKKYFPIGKSNWHERYPIGRSSCLFLFNISLCALNCKRNEIIKIYMKKYLNYL